MQRFCLLREPSLRRRQLVSWSDSTSIAVGLALSLSGGEPRPGISAQVSTYPFCIARLFQGVIFQQPAVTACVGVR